MLQVPQSTGRFTKAQIADITRGAKAVKREAARDPIFRALADLEKLRVGFVRADEAHKARVAACDPKLLKRPELFLSGPDMLMIGSIQDRRFVTAKQVDEWADRWTKHYQAKIKAAHGWTYGDRVIARIAELRSAIKKRLKELTATNDKYRKKMGTDAAYKRLRAAEDKWLAAEEALSEVTPTTVAGLVALLTMLQAGTSEMLKSKPDTSKELGTFYVAKIAANAAKAAGRFERKT